jgi:hypothetical protein
MADGPRDAAPAWLIGFDDREATMACRFTKLGVGVLVAGSVFGVLLYPSFDLDLIAMRETYRLGELTGIMHRGGNLGGQIMGYNYLRSPAWMHPMAHLVGALAGYGPALVLALLAFDRIAFGPLRATLCGRCGRRLEHLSRPACPACGAVF